METAGISTKHDREERTMKKASTIFLSSTVIVALLAISWTWAVTVEPTVPLSPGGEAPRECLIKVCDGVFVTIQAGPALGNSGLSDVFPIPSSCSGSPCLQWQYRWTFPSGVTPLEALTSVDTDVTVLMADPVAQVARIIPITAEGERYLKFAASGSAFVASYYTPTDVKPGTLTAGYTGKKGIWPVAGKCALAGADDLIIQQNQAVIAEQTYALEGCTVAFQVAPDNKVIPGTIRIVEGENCTTSETTSPIHVDGDPIIFVGAVQFTQEGSCKYCWTNTTGGATCSTCEDCCVRKTTNKCVKISSLSDPCTQCKASSIPPGTCP